MKFLLILALLYILYRLIMRSARKPGTLNDEANRAISATANAARYFIYGVSILSAVALCAYIWSVI